MRKTGLFLFYLLLFQNIILAEREDIVLNDYSYYDGLTTNIVNGTFKDSRGFLWICSINGLYRYDGYHFQKINTRDKILNCEVMHIAEDNSGNLWIATAKKGIIYYNVHSEEIFPVDIGIHFSFNINKILVFKQKIWLATDSGLIFFDQENVFERGRQYASSVILPEPSNASDQRNRITCLYVYTDSNYLWIGANGGLFVLNTANNMLKGFITHPQNAIRVIVPLNGKLLVGSWDGGVFMVDPHALTLTTDAVANWMNRELERKRVISACYDHKNRLWIATYGDGLYQFDLLHRKYIHFSCRQQNSIQPTIKSDIINHILFDKDGILWVSMNQPALTKIFFSKERLRAIELEKALPQQSLEVASMHASGVFPYSVWIATTRNGLLLYDIQQGTYRHFTKSPTSGLRLASDELSLVYEDRKGNLWLVHRLIGLYVVPAVMLEKLRQQKFISPLDANHLVGDMLGNSYITNLYEDSRGRLWIGHWEALHMLSLKPGFELATNVDEINNRAEFKSIYSDAAPHTVPFHISPTQAIVEITPTRFFAGTRDEGVIEINETAQGIFTAGIAETLNKHLPSKFVRCFYRDKENNILWIGTNTGICAYHLASNKFEYFDEGQGLSSENINYIIPDKSKNLWISTSYGISQISISKRTIKNYLFDTPLSTFNYYINLAAAILPNNYIAFSTNKVVVYFNPDSLQDSVKSLPLYFTNIKINNEVITPAVRVHGRQIISSNVNKCQSIKIPYNATLSLEFAAIDYIHQNEIKYKYRIDSNEWIALERNQRTISFYNQNPGEYVLQLQAQHPSGFMAMRKVKLIFLPPWWKTTWAYLAYLAIFLVLFTTYRNLILQRITQKARLEKEQFEKVKIQELDRLKTNFITNLAHEIRTPLSLIINPLESLVKQDTLDTKLKDKLNITLKNSYRLMKLTNELSDYMRIEKDMFKPEIKNYDIIAVVREIVDSFSTLADTMTIDFQFYSSFDQLVTGFDKEMMEKVVFNLLSNAFKFTPKNGSIVVEITTLEHQAQSWVKLSVTNTGEGIPADKVDRIFDRFYQVDPSYQGLGIGLSLVKSLVELHNGKIRVRSTPGSETCFEVLVPLQCAEQDALSNFLTSISVPATIADNEKSRKIRKNPYKLLIVEDDTDILQFLIGEFTPLYKVFGAQNGTEGLQIAYNIIPDIIITDIVMPGMNGLEMCRKIRENISTSHIPIVVLSAKAAPDQQAEGLDAGANIYMVKPFHIQVLKNQVEQLIQLKETIYRKFVKTSELIPNEVLDNDLDKQFIEKILHYIESNLANPNLSVDELAHHAFLSKVQLYRKIKAMTGMSVIEFITSIRLKTAARMILEKRLSFAQIAYETGFSSPSYFTKCFREHFGKTPSEYLASFADKTKEG